MQDILSILEELQSVSSTNAKKDIIKKHKHNTLFLDVVRWAYNPFLNSNMKKIPTWTGDDSPSISLMEINNILTPLFTREVTGNAAIEYITSISKAMSEREYEVIKRCISKDLRCGIAVGLINAVIKGFIPDYPCMLARPLELDCLDELPYPLFAQLKMDGMRANLLCSGDHFEVRGRSGKEIKTKTHFAKSAEMIRNHVGYDVAIDGELVVKDKDGNILPRKIGNGMLNKAITKEIPDSQLAGVHFIAWDIIPLNNFHDGTFDSSYQERLELLSSIKDIPNMSVIDTVTVNSAKELKQYFFKCLSSGEEGAMVKLPGYKWENKRSKGTLKMKNFFECDLLVTNWHEGTGKYAGMMGAIEATTSCGNVLVHIGTGFSDSDRKQITKDIVGKIISIKFNDIIESSTARETYSLFLPVYLETREDKEVADSYQDICTMKNNILN